MTTYKYKGLSPDGAKLSGVIKAYNEFEAIAQLRVIELTKKAM